MAKLLGRYDFISRYLQILFTYTSEVRGEMLTVEKRLWDGFWSFSMNDIYFHRMCNLICNFLFQI